MMTMTMRRRTRTKMMGMKKRRKRMRMKAAMNFLSVLAVKTPVSVSTSHDLVSSSPLVL
jgi:hypothetical protein